MTKRNKTANKSATRNFLDRYESIFQWNLFSYAIILWLIDHMSTSINFVDPTTIATERRRNSKKPDAWFQIPSFIKFPENTSSRSFFDLSCSRNNCTNESQIDCQAVTKSFHRRRWFVIVIKYQMLMDQQKCKVFNSWHNTRGGPPMLPRIYFLE